MSERRDKTAERLLALFRSLPPAEQKRFWTALHKEPNTPVAEQVEIHIKAALEYSAEVGRETAELRVNRRLLKQAVTRAMEEGEKLSAQLARYKPPRRNTARNREIVRLRDDEECTWGEIRRALACHPQWSRMQGGKPITVAAIRAAYYQSKAPRESS
jgi:hypothetical protein